MNGKTDFERETEREIDEDAGNGNGSHKKRKAGGSAKGHTARPRHDRARRQMGGVGGVPAAPAVMPMAGAPAAVNPAVARALQARRLGAAGAGIPVGAGMGAGLATARPAGFARGGRTNGEKWVPGQGVEDTDKPTRSRGDPMLEEAKKGGRLTAGERQKLSKSEFALPGKGEGPKGAGAGSYPIPDESHARNALARVSQHGSPSEKATVRRKVHAKYPDIEMSE